MRTVHINILFVLTLSLALFSGARVYSGGQAFTFTATLTDENHIALGVDSASFSATSFDRARLAGGTLIFSFDGPAPVRILAGADLPAGSDFMSTEDNFGPAAMGRTRIGGEFERVANYRLVGFWHLDAEWIRGESHHLFVVETGLAQLDGDLAHAMTRAVVG